MTQTTLCFLVKENVVLLAMKKRGFGKGKWNGVGGKLLPGEPPERGMAREANEEIGVTLGPIKKVAELTFIFEDPAQADWNQLCHVYLCREWESEPAESEEMAPRWFPLSQLPLDQMWSDDRFWLGRVLSGEKIEARFIFNSQQEILFQSVQEGGTPFKPKL